MEISFVGEQDGPVERELKADLTNLFRNESGVEVAYLATGYHGDNPSPDVFLCLLREDKLGDADLVAKIGEIFSRIFSSDQHVDVFFFDRADEHEIRDVCRAFYPPDRT